LQAYCSCLISCNETVVGDSREMTKTFDIIRKTNPRLGLDLNICKTGIFWPSCDKNKLCEGLSPSDIGRLTLRVKLLERTVSRYHARVSANFFFLHKDVQTSSHSKCNYFV
jgi:hypothetical protein